MAGACATSITTSGLTRAGSPRIDPTRDSLSICRPSCHASCRSRLSQSTEADTCSAHADVCRSPDCRKGGGLMTVSMRVMSAGGGYRYFLRMVAAADGDRSLSTPLTRCYAEAGTP